MGRPSNTHERRAQITSALMRVMAKRGFDGATVADVARAARLTAGLVHYHFDDKRDILLTLVAELAAQHMATLDRRLTQAGDDPRARLEAFIDFHLGLGLDADPDRLACWILISAEALRDAKVRAAFARAIDGARRCLTATIRDGVAGRAFTCNDVDAAAGALVAAIQGCFVLAAAAPGVLPEGSAAESVKRMAEGMLRGGRSRRRGKR